MQVKEVMTKGVECARPGDTRGARGLTVRRRALQPLREVQPREEGEVPETYPSGV